VAGKRSAACRDGILCAASQLLEERGYLDLTIEEVASRAHSGKQTIYRHWGSKPRLALAAMVYKATQLPTPDTGTLRGDLRKALGLLADKMRTPGKAAMLGGLLAEAQQDDDFGEAFREAMVKSRCAILTALLDRAEARGELPADVDRPVLLDLIYGPVWYRLLVSGEPLDEPFLDILTEQVLGAARAA
jgi:AcrR family transcriptional regulator